MSVAEDVQRIIAQEEALVFQRFDETDAFAIGSAIHARAMREGLALVVDIRFWDRTLFFAATPGTTAANSDWVRRKVNVVRFTQKSTYQLAVQRKGEDRRFGADTGLGPEDYVLAGGGFPIRIAGVGAIGAITVSGLPEREDHAVVVSAICAHIGIDYVPLALPASPA